MLRINCFVGSFRPGIVLPATLDLSGLSLSQHFRTGSMDDSGTTHLAIRVDTESRFNTPITDHSLPANAVFLQTALSRLTQNPDNVKRVSNIGLILADEYPGHSDLMGIMFDYGFNPAGIDPVTSKFTQIPREGCVIFLNAIRKLRPNDDDFRKEFVFTAIHELGHVFNLGHIESPYNFMSTSKRDAVFTDNSYFFHHIHNNVLQRAEFDEQVFPGGSIYNGLGESGLAMNSPLHLTTGKIAEFRISLKQNECWYFEPIELDITVRSPKQDITIPDKIDPGYNAFSIFITHPDGTITKYRSPRIYCQNTGLIKIGPNQPFHRDISIFGQSGGYTFTMPGEYKIQAVFTSRPTGTIRSNTVLLHIKKPMTNNEPFRQTEKLLRSHSAAKLMYHRNGRYPAFIIKALSEFSDQHRKKEIGINVSYALLRLAFQNIQKRSKSSRDKFTYNINCLIDSSLLSKNRRKQLKKLRETL